MSACADKELMLHGLIDGELDAANALAIEAHVKACPGCAAELERLQALGRLVRAPGMAHAAPAGLADRIEASIAESSRPAPRMRLGRAAPWGLSAALAASLALVMIAPGAHERGIEAEVAAGQARSLQANHLLDVASSDPHTVQAWFGGKLPFSTPVSDLERQGFTLAGGRLDYLHQRPVAAVVYRRGPHVINLYVWKSRPGERLSSHASLGGYNIAYWTQGGLEFWAVSDLAEGELETFGARFRQAIAQA